MWPHLTTRKHGALGFWRTRAQLQMKESICYPPPNVGSFKDKMLCPDPHQPFRPNSAPNQVTQKNSCHELWEAAQAMKCHLYHVSKSLIPGGRVHLGTARCIPEGRCRPGTPPSGMETAPPRWPGTWNQHSLCSRHGPICLLWPRVQGPVTLRPSVGLGRQ